MEDLKYPYSDIEKLLGYSFNVDCKEYDIMPISELVSYLKEGWVLYYESGKTNEEIKCLALVKVGPKEGKMMSFSNSCNHFTGKKSPFKTKEKKKKAKKQKGS